MTEKKVKPIIRFLLTLIITIAAINICIMFGSVSISFSDIWKVFTGTVMGKMPDGVSDTVISIILDIRLPRVLTAFFVGAALSISGAAMQGLLKNPLADGSTLGVSSGASLGAVLAIAFSAENSFLSEVGTFAMSILFAFLSMIIILTLSRVIDYSLSTNTIILIGVIFSMFVSSITSLIITIASDKIKHIIFWTMGSLSGSSYQKVIIMAVALCLAGAILIKHATELNAFAVGEENAMYIGVNVKRVKLTIMIVVSVLIGVSVSISGTIGFVGLVIPHITRLITGPNHKKLIPMSIFLGAVFLMVADLISRTVLSPIEIPIGVITSFIGSILFVYLYYRLSKKM